MRQKLSCVHFFLRLRFFFCWVGVAVLLLFMVSRSTCLCWSVDYYSSKRREWVLWLLIVIFSHSNTKNTTYLKSVHIHNSRLAISFLLAHDPLIANVSQRLLLATVLKIQTCHVTKIKWCSLSFELVCAMSLFLILELVLVSTSVCVRALGVRV